MLAQVVDRYRLNPKSGDHETWHIVLEIDGKEDFRPGDSVGIHPKNNSSQVDGLLEYFQLTPEESLTHPKTGEAVSSREWFSSCIEINRISKSLATYLLGSLPADLEQYDLLYFLNEICPRKVFFEEVVSRVQPLLPRLYSIASAPCSKIELIIAKVQHSERRKGVCSHYLIENVPLYSPEIKFFFQPARNFSFPQDNPLIMVGAGTGIAPFRSFFHGKEIGLSQKCWLFFGERNRHSDFFYEEFWNELVQRGLLRFNAAFSRDQEEKLYVQHRIWQERKDIWQWIDNGATILVCGNALRMAKDVDACLLQIAQSEGELSLQEAHEWIRILRHDKRYMRDVY